MPAFRFVRPGSLSQAFRELAEPGSCLHAGGTDLLGCIRDGVLSPRKVVSLSGLEELHGIEEIRGGGVRIGALTPLAEIASHPAILNRYSALAQAAASVASPQLRNQGTIGGNLCQKPRCWYFRGDFPCLRKGGNTCFGYTGENQFHCIFGGSGCYMVHPSDTAPALVALKAQLRIAGTGGTRTVPIDSFFIPPSTDPTKETALQPGEVLTEVVLPAVNPAMHSSYTKLRARKEWDFALAGVALAINMENGRASEGRIILSGVAPVPWRVKEAESILVGGRIDSQLAARVANAAVSGAEPLARNKYKVSMVRVLVEDAVLSMA